MGPPFPPEQGGSWTTKEGSLGTEGKAPGAGPGSSAGCRTPLCPHGLARCGALPAAGKGQRGRGPRGGPGWSGESQGQRQGGDQLGGGLRCVGPVKSHRPGSRPDFDPLQRGPLLIHDRAWKTKDVQGLCHSLLVCRDGDRPGSEPPACGPRCQAHASLAGGSGDGTLCLACLVCGLRQVPFLSTSSRPQCPMSGFAAEAGT